jgi:hypothetical protein
MIRKRLALLIAVFLIFGTAACAAPNNPADNPAENQTEPTVPGAVETTMAATAEQSQGVLLDTPAPSPSATPDFEAEKKIFELFTASDLNGSNTGELIAALPEINWTEYDKYTQGKTMDLIEWLYVLTIDNKEQALSLMNATDGLDGAYADGFAGVLGRIYTADPYLFVQCLSLLEQMQAEEVCRLVAYDCGYGVREDAKDAIAATRAFLYDGSLLPAEREAARLLIEIMDTDAA